MSRKNKKQARSAEKSNNNYGKLRTEEKNCPEETNQKYNKINPLLHIEQDYVKIKAAQLMVKEIKQGQRLTTKAALPARQSAKTRWTGRATTSKSKDLVPKSEFSTSLPFDK